ncbi:TetR/AcrR family transcriptional regulator [Sphingomonas sp. MG17]|uniref:TetR/AcrR family transcriptional regulator n=1 Tax=Sphingomonas tagetis TaxID=2949092 RepID=A0A9X2HMW7_9SPHN|nr:TetR/AcrR family transcriptional regulator [Sphingomonas tagetis]MCP3730278.1 TetR/AcrR family transcriptional regulator [Sphingomonas tagetis]
MRREQQKEVRRRAILHSAETLVRETHSVDFSMIDLGKRAGLSTATTYNLIGSKATVLYTLLNQSLSRLFEQSRLAYRGNDPIEHILMAADVAARFFTADPNFYKPMMMFLLGVPDPVHRPQFMQMAFNYWADAVEELATALKTSEPVEAADIALNCHILFAGALDLWVQNELDNAQFQAQVHHSVAIQLVFLANKRVQNRLLKSIRETRAQLPPLARRSEAAAQ